MSPIAATSSGNSGCIGNVYVMPTVYTNPTVVSINGVPTLNSLNSPRRLSKYKHMQMRAQAILDSVDDDEPAIIPRIVQSTEVFRGKSCLKKPPPVTSDKFVTSNTEYGANNQYRLTSDLQHSSVASGTPRKSVAFEESPMIFLCVDYDDLSSAAEEEEDVEDDEQHQRQPDSSYHHMRVVQHDQPQALQHDQPQALQHFADDDDKRSAEIGAPTASSSTHLPQSPRQVTSPVVDGSGCVAVVVAE
eukprot:Lankesteria_metandrocarpae@DN9364_c0_g1_i1.p1